MNPLNFTKVEWWSNPNVDGLGQACVGFTHDGKKLLTFDIRKTGSGFFPVFSQYCEVGSTYGHKDVAYRHYRYLFSTLKGYFINEKNECEYGILHDVHTYKFAR